MCSQGTGVRAIFLSDLVPCMYLFAYIPVDTTTGSVARSLTRCSQVFTRRVPFPYNTAVRLAHRWSRSNRRTLCFHCILLSTCEIQPRGAHKVLPRKSDIVPADRLDFVMFFYCYERPCLHRVAVYALEDRLPTCSSAVSNAFLPFTVFTTDMVVVYPADALICVLEGKKARGRCEGVSRFFLKCPRDLRWWGGGCFRVFRNGGAPPRPFWLSLLVSVARAASLTDRTWQTLAHASFDFSGKV